MKKIIFFVFAVLSAFLFISCGKENGDYGISGKNSPDGKYILPELTAVSDTISTRTSLNGTAVSWLFGDRMAIINTKTNKIYQYALNSGSGTTVGRFTAVGAAAAYNDLSDLVAVYPAIAASVSSGTVSVSVNENYSAASRSGCGITTWNSDSPCAFSNNDIKVSYAEYGNPGTGVDFKFKELGMWSSFVMDFRSVAYEGEKALSMSVGTTGGTCGLSGTAVINGAGSSVPGLGSGNSTSVDWTFSEPVSMSEVFTKSLMLLPSVTSSDMLKVKVVSTMRTFTFYAVPKAFAGGETMRFPITAGTNFTEGTANTNKKYTVESKTANCYMVAPGSSIYVPVIIKGNGGAVAGTGLGTAINPSSVGLLWETSKGLVSVGNLSNGLVTVTAGSNSGNAVIAAYSGTNKSGTILWSWHIWVTDYDPDNGGTTYPVTNSAAVSYTFMDRNLGAMSAASGNDGTIGLQYQWGRKDPFTASSSLGSTAETTVYDGNGNGFTFNNKIRTVNVSNNLSNSILNPEIFYTGIEGEIVYYDWYTTTDSRTSGNNALWGGASVGAPTAKTIFDPCPAGWRVPAWSESQSPWSTLGSGNSMAMSSIGIWSNHGVTWIPISAGFWPAAGIRNAGTGTLEYSGINGDYWSSSAFSSGVYAGYSLIFSQNYVSTSPMSCRAGGLSVRCVRE